jgi:hypothetical protein
MIEIEPGRRMPPAVRLDQAGRSLDLQDAIFAGAAGVFETAGDHAAELGRYHVQPLAPPLADLVQVALAARTGPSSM